MRFPQPVTPLLVTLFYIVLSPYHYLKLPYLFDGLFTSFLQDVRSSARRGNLTAHPLRQPQVLEWAYGKCSLNAGGVNGITVSDKGSKDRREIGRVWNDWLVTTKFYFLVAE